MSPTESLYKSLEAAYDHFNTELFNGKLPEVIFTVQRQNGLLGYFAPERWASTKGTKCHEIAINPSHIGSSRVVEVLQTLVHEMVHCWQHCFGKPGRNCYHNKEWAHKMLDIGLQPTSTGHPGGAITGQRMCDLPIEGGLFLDSCNRLIQKSFEIPWIDRLALSKEFTDHLGINVEKLIDTYESPNAEQQMFSAPDSVSVSTTLSKLEDSNSPTLGISSNSFLNMTYADLMPEDAFIAKPVSKKTKHTYICPSCQNKLWGKPDMNVLCGDCGVRFQ